MRPRCKLCNIPLSLQIPFPESGTCEQCDNSLENCCDECDRRLIRIGSVSDPCSHQSVWWVACHECRRKTQFCNSKSEAIDLWNRNAERRRKRAACRVSDLTQATRGTEITTFAGSA